VLVGVAGSEPLEIRRDGLIAELFQDEGRPDGHRRRAGKADIGVTEQRLHRQRVEQSDWVVPVGRRVEGVVGQAKVVVCESLVLELERVVLDVILNLPVAVVRVQFRFVPVDDIRVVRNRISHDGTVLVEDWGRPLELLVWVDPLGLAPQCGVPRPVVAFALGQVTVGQRVSCHAHTVRTGGA
jgi:hypothetical protein